MADDDITTEARLNLTWNGMNGDLPDPVPFDASDEQVKTWATEAIQAGIPGFTNVEGVDFSEFVVDRFEAADDLPNRLFLRPKTPFGTDQYTVVLYQNVPDSTDTYIIPGHHPWMDIAHMRYMGEQVPQETDRILTQISDALCEDPAGFSGDHVDLQGQWTQYKVEGVVQLTGDIRIICTGFLL